MGLAEWKRGLFTHEDKFNVHKLFGFPVLLHFIMRIFSVPFRPMDDLGFKASPQTALLLIMHLCLSISSLVFRIPKVRIKEGSRIWPEFRLHSIVFACRSLSCMAVVWVEQRYSLQPMYWANVVIVLATMIGADVATNSVDPASRSNTIRGLETTAAYKFSFSFMQFVGTCGCLVGLRSFGSQFMILFIIQIYAFTLTLRRKNLVSHRQTIFLYAFQLTTGTTVAEIEIWKWGGIQAMCMFPALAGLAMLLRVGLGMNKYIVWSIMGVVAQFARKATPIVPEEDRFAWWPQWAWPLLAITALSVVFNLFRIRSARAAEAKAKKTDDDTVTAKEAVLTALDTVYTRLFTKEDKFNVHKTLGFTCLASFLFRFANIGVKDMRFSASYATLLMILVHLSLSISSMIFRIPLRRIAGGYRIWPEYRLHSIVFACRSLALMLLTWLELRYELEPMHWLNAVIVISTCFAADVSSASVGPPGSGGRSSTIRDLDAGPATHFFFSAMQFHATMQCMLGIRRFSVQFMYVWIIQFNAFLMTIRRKNLAPQGLLVTIYGLMLVFGLSVAWYEHNRLGMFWMVATLGNVAGLLRMSVGVPKYGLWLFMAGLCQVARSTITSRSPIAAIFPYTFAVSMVALLALAAHKINKKRSSEPKIKTESSKDAAVPKDAREMGS